MSISKLPVLFLVLAISLGYGIGNELDIPNIGKLKGETLKTHWTERKIYGFKGIPYGKAPIRELRFKPSVKREKWEGVLDATKYGRICPQFEYEANYSETLGFQEDITNTTAAEDCLTLDIYTPEINVDKKLPVLFYIHGGSFTMGSSKRVQPGFLLDDKDIVLVAPQYRLGPLGFFCLDMDEAPGNAGLYDQLLALEWVIENIKYFGGDSNKITISGVSAGASSAALLSVSPLIRDSIKSVMIFSGSAVSSWIIDPHARENSLSIAKIAGCNNNTDIEVLECLQNLSLKNINESYISYSDVGRLNGGNGMGGRTPVVQKAGTNKILLEKPINILSDKKYKAKPLLIGVTKHEGLFLFQSLYENFFKPNDLLNNEDALKYNIGEILLKFSGVEDETYLLAPAVTQKYFNKESLGDIKLMQPGLIDYFGSAFFKGPARKMAELNHERGGESYVYSFDYQKDSEEGVDHAADQKYIFPTPNSNYTEEDKIVIKTLVNLLTDFLIYGKPVTNIGPATEVKHWSAFSKENENYLSIGKHLELKSSFQDEFIVSKTERRNSGVQPYSVLCLLMALFLTFIGRIIA